MMKRLEIFMIVTVFIFITAIILIVYSKQREQAFETQFNMLQKESINSAAYAINQQIHQKQRHVKVFAAEYSKLLNQLYNFPTDINIESDIKARLQQRFPNFLTFTITDFQGIPKTVMIDESLGQICQVDLIKFAKRVNLHKTSILNKVFVHPQPFHYHYDVMTPLYAAGINPRIFFVSFNLNDIITTLKAHQNKGQTLMLVRKTNNQLIEVTSVGTRDSLKREIKLSKDESKRMYFHADIPNSDWRLVSLPDKQYHKQFSKDLWIEAFTILAVVIFSLLAFIYIILKLTGAKNNRS